MSWNPSLNSNPVPPMNWEKLEFEYDLIIPGEPLPELANEPVLSIDLETCPKPEFIRDKKAATNPWRADILGVAIAAPGRAWYLPLRHSAPGSQNLDPNQVLSWLSHTLNAKPDRWLVNHNVKFDLKHLAIAGVTVPRDTNLWCTLMGSVLTDERRITHALKPLAHAELGMEASEEAMLTRYLRDVGAGKHNMRPAPVDLVAP